MPQTLIQVLANLVAFGLFAFGVFPVNGTAPPANSLSPLTVQSPSPITVPEKPILKQPGTLIEIISDTAASWVIVEPMDLEFRVYESSKIFVTTALSKTGTVKVLQFTPDVSPATPKIKWHIFSVGPLPSPQPVVLPIAKLTIDWPDKDKGKPAAIGDDVTRSWVVTGNTDKVTLDSKEVESIGSDTFRIVQPTTLFTLIAFSGEHSIYEQKVIIIGEKPPPVVSPTKVTRATFIWEKDRTAVPRPVAAALNKINTDSMGQIIASEMEVSTVNGEGKSPPAQYKIALEAALKAGIPCLVIQAGDIVVRVVKNPTTLEQVIEAAK